jgi:hypothetical protein
MDALSGCVLSLGKAEANIVVAVAGIVPVTDGGTDVPAVVDPGAAAQHTVLAFDLSPFFRFPFSDRKPKTGIN